VLGPGAARITRRGGRGRERRGKTKSKSGSAVLLSKCKSPWAACRAAFWTALAVWHIGILRVLPCAPVRRPASKDEASGEKESPRYNRLPECFEHNTEARSSEVHFPRRSRAKRRALEQSIAGQPHCHCKSRVVTVSKSISHEPGERLSSNRWAASFFGLSLRVASTSSRASSYRLSCMVARARLR